MSVPTLLSEVDVRLIAHKKLVASVADVDGAGVGFIAIADENSVKMTAYQQRHRVGGTVGKAAYITFFSWVYFRRPVTSPR